MCTALTLNNKTKKLFGRNMDIESRFGQQIVIVPRNFKYNKNHKIEFLQKYATIGMAYVFNNSNFTYPLFAEAANEKGLAMAGLYFPNSAYWFEPGSIKDAFELTPSEIIPYFLSQYSTVKEVKEFILKNNVVIVNIPISPQLPLTTLHYILTDKNEDCIVIEQTKDGLKVFDNPLGILTNNPSFDWHITNLSFYQNLANIQQKSVNWAGLDITPHGQGFGSVGIPGDWTPASRFIRAAFLKDNTDTNLSNDKLLVQFFHILNNVAMVKGTIKVQTANDHLADDITLYSSCIDLNEMIYYYKTYNNISLNAVRLYDYDLDVDYVHVFPFNDTQITFYEKK